MKRLSNDNLNLATIKMICIVSQNSNRVPFYEIAIYKTVLWKI
ncbi:MAG: hypothetical protein ACI87N_000401 [Flavobacteriales bacterium]|jgi:hypothetical protein